VVGTSDDRRPHHTARIAAHDAYLPLRNVLMMTPHLLRLAIPLLAASLLFGCQSAPPPQPDDAATTQQEMSAPVDPMSGRSEDDIKLDAGRKPLELLAFCGVKPGQRVAELGAGRGYTAELLARAVGPDGAVYAQNSPTMLAKIGDEQWLARLKKPELKNVTPINQEFDAPFTEDVKGLDLVLINLLYHDTVWLNVDRASMNAAAFNALKPGGVYVVIDHNAHAGAGVSEVQTLHRIEESVVTQEVLAAGFKLDTTSDFLRNPEDTMDWSTSPGAAGEKRGHSDRFALRFVKP
jgi:predicted methyltransferase